MDLTNGKKLSTEVLNERRRQAVRLRLSGMKLAAVSAAVGLSPGTIISAMKSYKGGWSAVAIAARGRTGGEGRTLTAEPIGRGASRVERKGGPGRANVE